MESYCTQFGGGRIVAGRYPWRQIIIWLVLLSVLPTTTRGAQWPMTFYAGPSTNKFFTQTFRDGDFAPNGFMLGVAVDPRLAYLGWGFSIESEAQITQYTFGHNYETFALGLGLRYDGSVFGRQLSIASYTGPSYATNPPKIGIGFGDVPAYFARKHWLNYVGVEIAVSPYQNSRWQGVFRIYHRSGCWGVYSLGADEGSTLALGIRWNFAGT